MKKLFASKIDVQLKMYERNNKSFSTNINVLANPKAMVANFKKMFATACKYLFCGLKTLSHPLKQH